MLHQTCAGFCPSVPVHLGAESNQGTDTRTEQKTDERKRLFHEYLLKEWQERWGRRFNEAVKRYDSKHGTTQNKNRSKHEGTGRSLIELGRHGSGQLILR